MGGGLVSEIQGAFSNPQKFPITLREGKAELRQSPPSEIF